jgi:hypothetical protein
VRYFKAYTDSDLEAVATRDDVTEDEWSWAVNHHSVMVQELNASILSMPTALMVMRFLEDVRRDYR